MTVVDDSVPDPETRPFNPSTDLMLNVALKSDKGSGARQICRIAAADRVRPRRRANRQTSDQSRVREAERERQ